MRRAPPTGPFASSWAHLRHRRSIRPYKGCGAQDTMRAGVCRECRKCEHAIPRRLKSSSANKFGVSMRVPRPKHPSRFWTRTKRGTPYFNLALALRTTGRSAEGIAVLDQLLKEAKRDPEMSELAARASTIKSQWTHRM